MKLKDFFPFFRNTKKDTLAKTDNKTIIPNRDKDGKLNVLSMEYQNIHQRVVQHVQMGLQNTVQALVIIGALLAFSISCYYDDSLEIFVNLSMCIALPVVTFSLIASTLSTNIKISSFGEYLCTIEKRINELLDYSNKPSVDAHEKIVDWERWRCKYGFAQDNLVFFDGAILYVAIAICAFISPIIRLLYLNNRFSPQLRFWVVLIPFVFALFLTIIIVLFKKLKNYRKRLLDLIRREEITYEYDASNSKNRLSKSYKIEIKWFFCFALLYLALLLLLLASTPFSFYNHSLNNGFSAKQTFAHRGLYTEEYPENTLSAFQNAIDNGYAIELDVWISSDGVPVVIHDCDLSRLCNNSKKITELSTDEIKQLSVLDKEHIPTLEEALDLINGQVPVIIEIKDYFPSGKDNKAVVNKLLDYSGSYAVQSFSPFPLYWLRHNYPGISRGQLFGDWGVFSTRAIFCLRDNIFNFIGAPDFINYDRDVVNYASLNTAQSLNIPIVGWLFSSSEIDSYSGYHVLFDGFVIDENIQ